jgi:hydrogenase maturation protease
VVLTAPCWTVSAATEARRVPRVVILGFGNPLRGDDGAGWRVAEAAAQRWPGLIVCTGQQLVPEWAAELTEADLAYFVDASLEVDEAELEALSTDGYPAPIEGHDLAPAQLLLLTHAVFGRAPRAFVLHVPAVNFDFGETLSPVAAHGVRRAVCLLNTHLSACG